MIDHLVGTPSPSWKRTQVPSRVSLRRSQLSIHFFPLGLSCNFLLAVEDHVG
jgi:hypothetical protein